MLNSIHWVAFDMFFLPQLIANASNFVTFWKGVVQGAREGRGDQGEVRFSRVIRDKNMSWFSFC